MKFCRIKTAGFDGAFISVDTATIVFDSIFWEYCRQHMGYKQSLNSRTFNACTNHRRQTIYVTNGFPARWYDKTIVKYDKFINDVKINKLYGNNTVNLIEHDEDG